MGGSCWGNESPTVQLTHTPTHDEVPPPSAEVPPPSSKLAAHTRSHRELRHRKKKPSSGGDDDDDAGGGVKGGYKLVAGVNE